MDDLKYRVKRVQEDVDYHARRPKTASGEEEKRRLQREMLSMIPEVERRIEEREERKERERKDNGHVTGIEQMTGLGGTTEEGMNTNDMTVIALTLEVHTMMTVIETETVEKAR